MTKEKDVVMTRRGEEITFGKVIVVMFCVLYASLILFMVCFGGMS